MAWFCALSDRVLNDLDTLHVLAESDSALLLLLSDNASSALLSVSVSPADVVQYDWHGNALANPPVYDIAYQRMNKSLIEDKELFQNHVVFLGHVVYLPDQPPLFAVDVNDASLDTQELLKNDPNLRFVSIREAAVVHFWALQSREVEILGYASQLVNWFINCKYCESCGEPLKNVRGGLKKACPKESKLRTQKAFYCRTDPSIIVLIHNKANDKILLVRSPRYPKSMYTCVSGFSDPCESLETTLIREVAEETGVSVDRSTIRYFKSQPWPYPRSIMMGFFAEADEKTELKFDEAEIEDGMWCTRSEVHSALKRWKEGGFSESNGKLFFVPPPSTLANQLITSWVEESTS